MKGSVLIVLAFVAAVTTALWGLSMFAFVGAGLDLSYGYIHAESYQGRVALVIGDNPGLLEGHRWTSGRTPIGYMTATHTSRKYCDWAVGDYGFGLANTVKSPLNGLHATVSVIVLPHWGILIVCLAGGGVLIRYHRHAPGTCLACGYNLRGTATGCPCPECGHSTAVVERRER